MPNRKANSVKKTDHSMDELPNDLKINNDASTMRLLGHTSLNWQNIDLYQ